MTHEHSQPTPPDPAEQSAHRPHRPYRQRANRPAGPVTLSCGPLEPRHVRQLTRVVSFELWEVLDPQVFASQWLEWCGLKTRDQASVLGLWLHPLDREPVLVGGAGLVAWPSVARVLWFACFPPYRAGGLACLTDEILEQVPLGCPLVSSEASDSPYGDQLRASGWRVDRQAGGGWRYAGERAPKIKVAD